MLTTKYHTWRWRLLTLWIVAFTAITFAALWKIHDLANDGRMARSSLCIVRDDLQRRIDASIDFLARYPQGIPGVPPKLIRKSILDGQGTVAALHGLRCPAKR